MKLDPSRTCTISFTKNRKWAEKHTKDGDGTQEFPMEGAENPNEISNTMEIFLCCNHVGGGCMGLDVCQRSMHV